MPLFTVRSIFPFGIAQVALANIVFNVGLLIIRVNVIIEIEGLRNKVLFPLKMI